MLSTLVLFSLTASTLQATAEPLPFISDDFTRRCLGAVVILVPPDAGHAV